MVIKHIIDLIKNRHDLWHTQLFTEGWKEGFSMGEMKGQQIAYVRLIKTINDLDPIVYPKGPNESAILDKIEKEMRGLL